MGQNNDICLLYLDGDLEYNDDVKNITIEDSAENLKPETECVVSGWGALSVCLLSNYPSFAYYKNLNFSQGPTLPQKICDLSTFTSKTTIFAPELMMSAFMKDL